MDIVHKTNIDIFISIRYKPGITTRNLYLKEIKMLSLFFNDLLKKHLYQ